MSNTDISTLPFDCEEDEKIDENNLSRSIADLSLSLQTRVKAIDLYAQKEGKDNTIEIINKLSTMYEMSKTSTLRNYLFSICSESKLDPFLKSIAAQNLCLSNENDDLGYQAVNIVYPLLGTDVGTPYKIEMLKLLMKNDKYKDDVRNHFCRTINDQVIDSNYRYKMILGLEYRPEIDVHMSKEEKELRKVQDDKRKAQFDYFIKEGCMDFVRNEKNLINLRILASQNLLQKGEKNGREYLQDLLLSIASNAEQEYNLRADATDVLLQLGDKKYVDIAREIILTLGHGNSKRRSLYSNAQNVHTREIEDSVKDALEYLQTFDMLKINKQPITLDYVENEIGKLTIQFQIEEEKVRKIKIALNRIGMDRVLYSKFNCTLEHILLQVWSYIIGHENEEELKKRILEELVEMAGTCSSGFATRIINTISGFGDFNMRISWRDQIISNFTGRLNARIREMDNLNQQEKVMAEMTVENSNYENRKHFLKFLRKNILSIRGELYEEFKVHLDDTDFDLHFRAAVSMYETGHFRG